MSKLMKTQHDLHNEYGIETTIHTAGSFNIHSNQKFGITTFCFSGGKQNPSMKTLSAPQFFRNANLNVKDCLDETQPVQGQGRMHLDADYLTLLDASLREASSIKSKVVAINFIGKFCTKNILCIFFVIV